VLTERPAVVGACWLPGRPSSVRQAREFAARMLRPDWPGLDDVLLLTSEIASNAVRHTASADGSGFDVTVAVSEHRVRVEIADKGSSSEPRITDAGGEPDLLTTGRGLRLVDALADRWGHDGDELGRVVWFEVTSKPDAG
jgi:anti-sigma regulatory factor (Ser/Thr protein kinase)